jgi:hypothetical protein
VKVGERFHSLAATAVLKDNSIALQSTSDRSWRRDWSGYSHRWATGFGQPGRASVNTPDYNWRYLTAGAYRTWRRYPRHHYFSAYSGTGSGFGRFIDFHCTSWRGLITCKNSLGDAIRYQP